MIAVCVKDSTFKKVDKRGEGFFNKRSGLTNRNAVANPFLGSLLKLVSDIKLIIKGGYYWRIL